LAKIKPFSRLKIRVTKDRTQKKHKMTQRNGKRKKNN